MTRGRKPKNPADFGKQFEELKKTIPAEKEHSPEVKAVGKAMEAFCENPNKETEKELYESRAIGGGITIFGDRETTEKVCEELKKYDNQMGKTDLSDLPETEFEKATKEGAPLEELQELEKKLRACTDETPRDIKYEFSWETCLHIEYNNINVSASIAEEGRMVIGDKKGFRITAKKPYLATAQKMHEVLKEWRGE